MPLQAAGGTGILDSTLATPNREPISVYRQSDCAMNRPAAQAISEHLESAIRSMSLAVDVAMAELAGAEAEKWKKAIAIELGNLSVVLDGIYDEHPDLAPPGLR